MSNATRRPLGQSEFVALIALMTSLVALSIDAMLPALPQIGRELGALGTNEPQKVIAALMVGLSVGQLLYGPISDSTGRRPMVFVGFAIFAVGCVLSLVARDFQTMLLGRFLQGFGVAGPRSVAMALIRDLYVGRDMAKIMSTIMSVFILMPILAPILGQEILDLAGWRAIFTSFLVLGVVSASWFAWRQPETLAPERRRPLSLAALGRSVATVVSQQAAMGFTICAGISSGAFIGYLNSSQQIFQEIYATGEDFVLWFGLAAASIGAASWVNRRLVTEHGMLKLTRVALASIAGLSIVYFVVTLAVGGVPPFWSFLAYLLIAFFFVGIVFGNINSLAMESLGHVAGVGAAVVASLSLAIALVPGYLIGQALDGTIVPFVGGYAILSLLSLPLLAWGDRGRAKLADVDRDAAVG